MNAEPSPPPSPKKLFTVPRLIIAALLCMIAVIFFWSYLRAQTITVLGKQLYNAKQQGYLVEHQALDISGFPLALNLQTNKLRIQSPNQQTQRQHILEPKIWPKTWSVRLDDLRANTKTLSPLTWGLSHHGTARIDFRAPTGTRYLFDMIPAPVTVNIRAGLNGTIKRQSLTIGKTKLQPLVGSPPPITAAHFLSIRSERQLHVNVITVQSDKLQISNHILDPLRLAFGQQIDQLDAQIHIDHWDDLLDNYDQYRRHDSNHIRAKNFQIIWGTLDIVGHFDLNFKHGELDGSVFLKIKNLDNILDRLPKNNLIPTALLGQVKRLLSGLETDNQGRQEIEISIQKRKIKYGFFTLYQY